MSEATGWDVVPPTVLREGPFGPGMVQLWIDTVDDDDEHTLVDVMAPAALPAGLAAGPGRARLRRRAGGARRTPTTSGCAG